MRTCRELGIETVAVYSDIDRVAAHVLYADRALALGGETASESYLLIDKIIAAAQASEADAIHPGYGFLSENADFAEALDRVGLRLIGPPAESMRQMGDKTRARETVSAAGVPVVPGDAGPTGRGFSDPESALAAAEKVGYPVMLKASAGGGGKGMRLVTEPGALASSLEAARREAESSFGDSTVYIERAIIGPRHVEIQIFADNHGNVVHLGERDCSIQRRHQKVVEEAPSPALDPGLRTRMGEAATAAARVANYRGAGTVEFLLDSDGEFFFLEMNTRLQVEHPVTEAIHDVDLVAWQIAIAEGARLPLTQEEIDSRRSGHAIECRIYAEDPVTFMPSAGRIDRLREPSGPHVRNDSGVYQGATISPFYDPLISKLVTWGEDRSEALTRMRRALTEYAITGIRTNLAFHRRLLEHEGFCGGTYDTGFIEREILPPAPSDDALVSALALAVRPTSEALPKATREESGWARPGSWRSRFISGG